MWHRAAGLEARLCGRRGTRRYSGMTRMRPDQSVLVKIPVYSAAAGVNIHPETNRGKRREKN